MKKSVLDINDLKEKLKTDLEHEERYAVYDELDQLNKDYYEARCINKQKPELDCSGKCQVRKEAQKDESPISNIKYSFERGDTPQGKP